ncbi:MAG TPA: hypothetical protein VEA63_13195 [Opitutus sp.]|nr:hypothetical protein [Opitutus sp.]
MLGVATMNVVQGGPWLSVQTFLLASGTFWVGAVAFIAPLSALIVFVGRIGGIRRPWADTVGGAIAAVAGVFAADAVAELIFYGNLIPGDVMLVPFALIAGLVAGPTYWWLAGRPQPPYMQAES